MRMPFSFSTSVVSEKVRSVEMDLRSLKAMTGLGSMPWALRQMAVLVLAEDLLHQFDGHFLNGLDALDPEVAQRLVGLGADRRNFANGEGGEEGALSAVVDLRVPEGLARPVAALLTVCWCSCQMRWANRSRG